MNSRASDIGRWYRAVVFDMDGVLLRSMHIHYQAWQCAGVSLGIRVSRKAIFRHEGEPGAITVGWLAPARDCQRLLALKERCFTRWKHRIRPYAGALPLLQRLARTRLKLGLVTGTSRAELRAVLPNSLRRLFHASVTGDEVRHGKPHPEPYRKICRKLRLRPADILVVENAPFGIQSARGAHMGGIIALTTTVSRHALSGAERTFRSLGEFSAWLDRRGLLRVP